MASYETSVRIPLDDDKPTWLSHFELTRQDDQIIVQLVKTNGHSYCDAKPLDLHEFNDIIEILLTP